MKKILKKYPTLPWTIASFCIILVIWQIGVIITGATIFPKPTQVFESFVTSLTNPIGRNTLPEHILYSLSRVVVGYSVAAVTGILLGLLLASFESFRAFVKPVFDFLRPIPPIAWIPLAVLWFGVGELPKYFLIWIAAFTIFTLNTFAGATRVDPQLIGAARMLGATKFQVFTKVILPATVPHMFTGGQIAISNSWMAVVGAEMIKANEGVGWIITAASNFGNYKQVFVGMIAIAIVGYIISNSLNSVERRLLKWNVQGK